MVGNLEFALSLKSSKFPVVLTSYSYHETWNIIFQITHKKDNKYFLNKFKY